MGAISLGGGAFGALTSSRRPESHLGVCLGRRQHRLTLPDATSWSESYAGRVTRTRPDRGGGIARNGQKSALNASLLHTPCNSRAICPSQRHIRVTHNPWVACSSSARPTVGSSPPSPSHGGVPPIVSRAIIPADTSTSSRRTPGSQVDSSMLSAPVGSIRKLASGRHQGVPNGSDPMRHVARQLSRPRWTPRTGCTKSAS